MRSSNVLQQIEIDAYQKFCRDNNIDGSSEANGNLLGHYVVDVLNEDITAASLARALEACRPQVVFLTPGQIVQRDTGFAQSDALVSILTRRPLDPAYLTENATAVAQFLMSNGWSLAHIDIALTNMGQKPGWHSKLKWKAVRQDREKEILAAREKNKQELAEIERQKAESDEVRIPPGLPAYLHEHYRQTHEPPRRATVEAAKRRTSYYEKRSHDLVASIQSNLDRAEAAEFLNKAGAWGWEVVFRQIEGYVARRTRERQQARLAALGR